ncbi:MAG: hypothetical protein L6Q37_03210 [Bdellovibrionaceae bacterium]|nr:hypothetical protein [Pseudobdellovibrionaceae bacterium]NUM57806.1 hypothetical protein [Pseudobdellovibrionaceae bacterium]
MDKKLYEVTYESCQNHPFLGKQVLETFLDSVIRVGKTYSEFYISNEDPLLVYKTNKFTSPELNQLINSFGFIFALEECFGKDSNLKNMYVISLLLVESIPKGLGMYSFLKSFIKKGFMRYINLIFLTVKIPGSTEHKFTYSGVDKIVGKLNSIYDEQINYQKELLQRETDPIKRSAIQQMIVGLEALKI